MNEEVKLTWVETKDGTKYIKLQDVIQMLKTLDPFLAYAQAENLIKEMEDFT